MSSIIFKISDYGFVEAVPVSGLNYFAVRIITYVNGREGFIYLPQMTIDKLTALVGLMGGYPITNVYSLVDLKQIMYSGVYY